MLNDIVLTDEQQFFIDSALAGKNILVDACIGSGKTTTIQRACSALSPKRVLYLTYNRRLYDDACKKIHEANTTIATFHRFAAQCCFGNEIPQTSMNTVCRQFANSVTHIPKYDVVIVDEYQDLREDTAAVLNAICRLSYLEYDGFVPQFLIVGDMQQKIYDTSNFKADDFIRYLFGIIKNDEYMRFTKCFRLASGYAAEIGQAWNKSIVGCNPNSRVEDVDSLCHLVNILKNYEPKDILVLGGKMPWGARTQLQNMLEEQYPHKFNKSTVYASMDEQDEMQSFDTSEAAIFTTYDSAKGLERKVCVVCDFTEKYLEARQKHSVSRQILKNIFLVAASRGKERIIFYTDRRDDKLPISVVGLITGDMPIDMKPVPMSHAFEHKYEEDIRDCMDFLTIEKIQDAGKVIKATKSDGFIDLSVCIGIHAQATYFDNFDIDAMILRDCVDAQNKGIHLPEFKPDWSLQKKILYYVAMESGQLRYLRDIKKKFVSKASDKELHERLATVFDGSEAVELPCNITFQYAKNAVNGVRVGDKTMLGRCDAFTHVGELYELKFVDTISPDHELQAALYAIAFGMEYAIIWNLQDDTKLRVSVDPNRISEFLQCVCKCISKDMLTVDAGSIHISG